MLARTDGDRGVFARWRVHFFGERRAAEETVAAMSRRNAGQARLAHACATALIILFSAASFIALGSDTLLAIEAQWARQSTVNWPSAISLSVITLMVLAFDVAMVYAASVVRTLATRRATFREMWVHILVMIGVAVAESTTYAYMAWKFERPADGIAWALIGLRAVTAPLLAVYLSMARALPVTARDIMAQVELASGIGVLQEMIQLANDRSVPMLEKADMFNASAIMTREDRDRLAGVIAAAQRRVRTDGVTITEDTPPDALSGPSVPLASVTPITPLTPRTHTVSTRSDASAASSDGSVVSFAQSAAPRRKPSARTKARQTRKARVVRTGDAPNASYEDEARAAWAAGHRTVTRMERNTSMSHTAAQGWVRTLKAEGRTPAQAEAQEA